jgi:nicotinamide riboside transporter PnuC
MADTTQEREHFREGRGMAALWFAVLAGPVAWMLGLNAAYGFVRVACDQQSLLPLHGVSLLTLLLALAGGATAWREWRRAGGEWPDEGGGTLPRSRFMTALGLMAGPFFALVIVAQWTANLFFNPCMAI